jgi:poly(hydroxyalkanoate) depolymerase family esterase
VANAEITNAELSRNLKRTSRTSTKKSVVFAAMQHYPIGNLVPQPLFQKSWRQLLVDALHESRVGRRLVTTRWLQRVLPGLRSLQNPTAELQSLVQVQDQTHATNFSEASFPFGAKTYPYRLYVPMAVSTLPHPLIVLLHGCKQDAKDFAQGTAMNALAEQHGCMVLYPEQLPKANQARCWNWFEPEHQQLDQGEPGMIAALTRHVLNSDHGASRADPDRVYIAGLSAGGAMAAVVAGLYPDLFAAVGVHSGLPAGAAQDMLSAFTAMRTGANKGKRQATAALPTIVFHGSADTTVHPDNGEHILGAALTAWEATGMLLERRQEQTDAPTHAPIPSPHQRTERRVYRSASGPSYVEHWCIADGPHAWSGGDAAGSFTDPSGPSASEAMLRFFLQHKKRL